MNKKCYILNADWGASGVVKLEKGFADVDIKNYKPLEKNEVFEVYFLEEKKLCRVGKMTGGKEKFVYREPENCSGIIITRGKNIEFWGGKDDVLDSAQKLLSPQEREDDAASFFPQVLTAENYFGGGFKWRRINGYYSMYKYSIVMHVLSIDTVRQAIARRGYYLLGVKKGEGIHISIALPQVSEEENIFEELEEYSYSVKLGNRDCRALCLVIDESGEYFLY